MAMGFPPIHHNYPRLWRRVSRAYTPSDIVSTLVHSRTRRCCNDDVLQRFCGSWGRQNGVGGTGERVNAIDTAPYALARHLPFSP